MNEWLQGLDLSQLDPSLFDLGADSFGYTGSPFDISYQPEMFSSILGGVNDDQLTDFKKRVDTLKGLIGLQFDSRLGYLGATNYGTPTFNFPGLTAGGGIEQAGTAEQGSGNMVVGFDEDTGEPIVENITVGTGGGGGGGSSRSNAPDVAGANRYLSGLQNSSSEMMRLAYDLVVNQNQDPTTVKLQLSNSKEAGNLSDEQLKMVYDSVDKAWEYQGVTASEQLPKSSDLGTQVGKWGTVDPSLSYTPDTLPEDILPLLGDDYLTSLDWNQRMYDENTPQWNKFLKGSKDSFQNWQQERELTMDDISPGALTQRREEDSLTTPQGDPNYLKTPNRGNPYSALVPEYGDDIYEADTPKPQQQGERPDLMNPIAQAIIAGVNGNRGARTPWAKNEAGEDLDTELMISADDAKAMGLKATGNWFADSVMKAIPGQHRKVYTTKAGADAYKRRKGAEETYKRNVGSNERLRAMIAADLAQRGRTPQSDDMRNRAAVLRSALGYSGG